MRNLSEKLWSMRESNLSSSARRFAGCKEVVLIGELVGRAARWAAAIFQQIPRDRIEPFSRDNVARERHARVNALAYRRPIRRRR